jgi:hypothetical protein
MPLSHCNKLLLSKRIVQRAIRATYSIALEERSDTIISGTVQLILYFVTLLLVAYNFTVQIAVYGSASWPQAASLLAMAAFFVFEGLKLSLSMRDLRGPSE